MKNLQAISSVSTLQVLEVLSDRTSVDIFNAIAENVTTSDNIIQLLDISAKQFYSRHSDLLKTGLIRRRNNVLFVTSFGRLIYHSLLIIVTSRWDNNMEFPVLSRTIENRAKNEFDVTKLNFSIYNNGRLKRVSVIEGVDKCSELVIYDEYLSIVELR
jgi:hypothetical protein